MIAEKIHIYSPDEIDKIEPMSELERCANFIFDFISIIKPNACFDITERLFGRYYNIEFKEHQFDITSIQKVAQLMSNVGWDVICDMRADGSPYILIHKSHFE